MTLLETIDRDLRTALAVEPSPGFVARVRTRIASEAESAASDSGWRWSFGVAAAGVAAVVVATAFLVSRPQVGIKSPDAAVAKADIPPDTTPAPLVAAIPSSVAKAPSKVPRPRHVPNAQPATPRATLPEVLVDPREAAALRAVIAATRAGAIDLAPLVRASAPSALETPPIVAIAIAPLTIDPLGEGGRQ